MKKSTQVRNTLVNGPLMDRSWTVNGQLKSRFWSVFAPFLFVAFGLFGVNESAWAGTAKLTLRAIANSSKGGYVMVSESSNASFSGTATDQSKDKTGDTGWTGLSSKKLTLYAYASAKAGCVFLGWAESATGTIISTDTKISYTTDKLYYSQTDSKTYYAIFARMAANTPAAGSTTTFDDTNVGDESGWKQIKIDHAHAGTVTISQEGDGGDFFVAATTSTSVELSSFSSTTETTRTIYVKFVPQNNGLRTCTLTVSSNNGLSSLTYYLQGTGYNEPSVTWVDGNGSELVSGETTLSAGDVLRATCTTGQTISYSGFNTSYFTAGTDGDGNPILTVREDISGTINNLSVTANLAKNTSTYYAAYSEAFTLNVTNLTPQTIEWTNDIADISDEEIGHTIPLNAVAKNAKTGANTGQTISYSMAANDYLSLSGNVLTVKAIGGPVAITATAAGNADFAPTSVTKYATVIDMSHPCATSDSYNGKTLNKDNKSLVIYPTLPGKLTFNLKRSTNLFVLNKFTVKEYNSNNSLLATTEYDNSSISTSGETKTINCNVNATKIEFYCDAYLYYSCTVSNVSTTRVTTSSVSLNALSYATDPGQSLGKQVSVSYSNIPVFLSFKSDEDAGVKGTSLWSLSTSKFGGCGKKGSQNVTVTFQSNTKGNFTDKLYVRNNVGTLLHTIDLSASVTAQEQFLKSWNIADAYNTTDQVTLQASTTVDNTDFTFTATTSNPANIVSISNAGVMTFSGSGTATIRAYQPGDAMSQEFETTHNITINKVTPSIATNPTGTAILYRGTLNGSTLSGGSADVTLRGVAHSAVAGSFAWADPTHVVMDAEGTHNYSVTFTPTDGGMYTTKEFTIPISITRATQAIVMKDSTVKVAVNGIDEGKADSYLDLDDLIVSQTSDIVNNNQRAGAVSYVVLSDNSDKATIATGNIFSATEIGEYTIRAIKAQTNYYNLVADTFVVTVGKRANTMVLDNTAYEKFVDDTVHNVRSVQNSDGTIHTSSTNETLAYYDINQNKIFFPNSDEQEFGKYTTVTIKIWQDETVRFEALDTQEITLTVKKYETVLSGQDYIIKVDNTQTGEFAFTYTSTAKPSNDPNDDFYYTINEPNFDNEALNNGTELITFDPSNNQISAHNAGRTKLSFFQKETRLYTGATAIYNIAVEKHANNFTSSWNVWQKAMDDNQTVNAAFTTTHGDYGNYPISVEQTYGEDVATLTGTADAASITTNTTHGYAIWHLSQAENYKYYSAEADVLVMVGVPAPPTCYVYEDLGTEHKFSTSITDAEGHFDNPIVINSPIDKIWYSAKRQLGGVNYFVVQYSTDGGSTWKTVSSPDLSTSYQDLEATFPAMTGTKKITHVRFGATTGATLSKWYKDVRISRKAYLNIQNAQKETITSLPTLVCTLDENTQAQAKFYIDYSTCADSIIIESNESHFTVSRSLIYLTSGDNLNSAKEEITVTYNSSEEGSHNGVITVRTDYQIRAISVSGETTKREQTLTWQEGYTNNPLTLPIGLKVDANHPAATSSSGADVKYASSNEDVVKILDNGYSFMVIGAGSATLTATAPANGVWNSISDTRVINTTHKTVQEIVWNQTFPRFMNPGDVIDLDAKVYIRNLTTGEKEYSEARTQALTYSCPLNNGILSVSGNKMTILAYGEMDVTASVGGNAEYAAAADVTVTVNAHQQSAGCPTPLVVNHEDIIQMFEVNIDFSSYTNLTTEQMISDEIAIDHSNGKPDKLSFSYEGEEYAFGLLNFFGGYIKFEQHVNSNWIAVENSRVEPKKNEWKTLSNLQLDENADALRIIREAGATGYHNIKDLQVTRKQYLVPTQVEVDLDTVRVGQAVPSTVGFDYSDIKGDLTARTTFTNDVTLANNGVIDLECGSFGHYNLGFTYLASAVGDWKDTIEIYDNIADLTIRIALKATVTANEEYIFVNAGNWNEGDNWSTQIVPNGVNVTVASDLTVNSAANVNSITINEGVTVTVKSGVTLVIGNGNPKDQTTYGNLYVEDGGQVILHNGELRVNDFFLDASIGSMSRSASSGQVNGEETKLQVGGESYFQICFDPVAISYGWYDFVLPFDVDVIGGIYLPSDLNTPLVNNVDFAIMEFSEADRAANKKAWHWFSGTLKAGKLYTITLDETQPSRTTYVFKKKASAELGAANTYNAECTTSAPATDRGWNGLGNGTLRYCQLNTESLPDDAKMQIYDHNNDCYKPCEATEYTYAIGTAFFIQVNENNQTITLDTVADSRAFRAPSRDMRSVEEFRLALKAEDTEYTLDNLWISASEEATEEYEIGKDLLKMGTPTSAKTAQMWATKGGLKLCDIETRMEGNGASSDLNLYVPQAGMYELEVEKMPEDATLYLTYNGRAIWVLSASPYMLDLNAGVTEGYGLRIEAQAPQVATGFENGGLLNDANNVRKVVIDNTIYIITPEGKMYDIVGKSVKY